MGSAKLEVDDGGPGYAEALVQESPDGLIALAPDGTVRFWNQGAQALFGYCAAECLGRSLEALVIPEDRREEARAAMMEVLDRGVALYETERRRKDGSRVAVDVALRLVRSIHGDIQFVAASHKDITQLRALRDECATEAKFRGLLEAAPDAMVIVGEDGRIALVNSQTENLFGYQRAELLGQPIELLVPEHFRRTRPGRRSGGAMPLADRAARPMDGGLDLFGRRKNGSEFPCEISLSPMETESGRLVTAAIRDITARKKVEAKFRGLLEAAPDAMVIINHHGKIVLVNSRTETLFGYDRKELIGQSVEMLLPERARAISPERRNRFFADPKARSMGAGLEIEGLRKDGTTFPAEASISPLETEEGTLILSAVRDVTERRKAEEKFRALMEAAPDAMVIVGQDGRIVLVNAQTEKLFGYQREELIGQSAEMLIPERFRSPAGRPGHFTDSGVRSMGHGHELCGLRRDHTEFPIELSSSPLQTEEGLLISNSIRDVTERKQLEARMQQANRLKSEFLANMSHELRTPLNAIIGFTELMHYQEVEPGSAEQKEFLVHILTSGRHLLQLVNDILDLSKIEAGKMEFRPEAIDLRTEVQEVVGMLSSIAASKRIEVTMSVDDLGDVMLDPARLKQVMYNYLSNALKFTPEGGRVAVRMKAETPQTFR
ncbi:MAG TPA: PAS domain S-box protein, partial [Polyangia bacterium]